MNPYRRLELALRSLRTGTDFVPELGLVLGSGLGGAADMIKAEAVVEYGDIEGFPRSTVPGHGGRFIFGTLSGVQVAAMQGRVHYYEGYDMEQVVMPVRLMGLMGAKAVFLTNAAGGMGDGFEAGDLMLITDHISSFVPSPLRGPNSDKIGERFPDMSKVYDMQLREAVLRGGEKAGVALKQGVYLQTPGPQFETPAEIRFYRSMGADAVGMSTACEAVAARHMGMRVCGVSCISNLAAGISPKPLSHREVMEAGAASAGAFCALVEKSIEEMRSLL